MSIDAQHHIAINRMLELTRPTPLWQRNIIEMLKHYIMEKELREALSFLQHVISVGKEGLLSNHCHSNRHKLCLSIDMTKTPKLLDIDRWKKVLISLGFEIEQPDGYHTIENISVILGEGVMLPALEGMQILIFLLNGLQWNILRMVLYLAQTEATALSALVSPSNMEVSDQEMAKDLYARYPGEMKQLGFEKRHKMICRTATALQDTQLCQRLALTLTALFHEGPPDLGTFV